jgi:hypothetical protein
MKESQAPIPMIAPCGLDCSRCEAYQAWKADDQDKREHTARNWSAAFGISISAADIDCSGCGSLEGPKIDHCYECGIRACADKLEHSSCALCNSYPCEELSSFLSRNIEARENLEALKQWEQSIDKTEGKEGIT